MDFPVSLIWFWILCSLSWPLVRFLLETVFLIVSLIVSIIGLGVPHFILTDL